MSEMGTLIFEIYKNGQLIRSAELAQDVIKVGKLPSSHLRLDDPNVSRIHAVIERSRNGDVHIIDLGSSRGTHVNGKRINKCKLAHGDEIQLGDTRIVFKQPQAAVSAPPAFDPEATQVGFSPLDAGWGAPGAADDAATQIGISAMPEEPMAPLAAKPAPALTPAASASPSISVSMPRPQHAAAAPAAQATSGAKEGYDAEGNWHDGQGGWYDTEGNYFDGQGGWYDAEGNYFDGQGGWYDPEGNYHLEGEEAEPRISDVEHFSEAYAQNFDSSGRGNLEVAFLWMDSLLRVDQIKRGKAVTIGEDNKNDFQMKHPAIPAPKFSVVSGQGSSSILNFTDRMDGVFYIDDNRFSLRDAIQRGIATQGGYGKGSYALAITPTTRARLDFGNNTVLVHHVAPAAALPKGFFNVDFGLVGNLAASMLLHAVFMFLVFFIPPDPDSFKLDSFDVNNRFVSQIIKPEEPEEEEPEWLKNKNKDKKDEGAKAKGASGKAGDRDATKTNRKLAIKGDADNKEVQLAKDREVAYNAGALKVLQQNSALTSMFGEGNKTFGNDAITALGDGNGSKAGDAFGLGAFGSVGVGRGAGGVSERGIGAGSIGGNGSLGKAAIARAGRNAGKIEERATRVPQVVTGRPTISGALDKKIIKRVINKHRREIKYCYEKELIRNKTLSGKVVVQFTISGTGSVVAAVKRSSTLNNASVERCITSKIRRWVFPEPNGGGIVKVSYPFVFTSK